MGQRQGPGLNGRSLLVHGFGAGGNADVISRIVAERLAARLGQPVVVEAKTGAGGRIAAAYTAKAPADGYTLAVLPGGHAIAAAMYERLPYDTVNDFSFISMLTDFPFILATYPDHPVKTIPDLIAVAKASGSPMIYGTAGNGTGQHLSGALFASMAGIPLRHLPFRGGALGSQNSWASTSTCCLKRRPCFSSWSGAASCVPSP